MLTFDSVKLRLDREQSLSYMEFNYMILQAYDFLELIKKKIVFYKLVAQISGEILSMVWSLLKDIQINKVMV
jgi:tyrosyl-tRNA synthetase